MRWLFVEKFTLTTHHQHTEIMRLLYESIHRKGLWNAEIEGVTSYKKFEIRKSSSWWSRHENSFAEGTVEEVPQGSVIRVRMAFDMGRLFFVIIANLIIATMLLVSVVRSSFDLELLFVVVGGLILMLIISGIFRLIFISEVNATRAILMKLLNAQEIKETTMNRSTG